MSDLPTFIAELGTLGAKMRRGAEMALYAESIVLRDEFMSRSPKDTGTFKNDWKVNSSRNVGSFASVTISNDTPIYGVFMEYGAMPNRAPWYFPKGITTSGKPVKNTGKLKQAKGGLIWAGGLSPGHDLTVGGAIGAGLFDNTRRMNELVKVVADGVIGAWL